MCNDEQIDEQHQRFYREVTADRLRDWLLKPEMKVFHDEIENLYNSYPGIKDAKRMAVRGLLLKELAKLQGEPATMELAMILSQIGLFTLDWDRLEEDLGLEPGNSDRDGDDLEPQIRPAE